MTDPPDNDIICMDTIKPRKIKPQNIVCRILSRERGYVYQPKINLLITKNWLGSVHEKFGYRNDELRLTIDFVSRILSRERGGIIREFYKNIYPNLTIINVEKPAGFLRKFSPDGKYLIAFTYDQTSLEIYRFKGSGAAAVSICPYGSVLLTSLWLFFWFFGRSATTRQQNRISNLKLIFRFSHSQLLLNGWEGEVVPNSNEQKPYAIRSQIFNCLFKVGTAPT